eukprot:TRINITY_DN66420_c0_g1_i1.p1 TRINITY_DN66420_c0_g1~~TRINITY_DN66420_c0_g1_i1.p1  ORF type:complete len:167 (+),score=29.46 TRINITY_DN66420_c0_g1_i1:27-527(+)
MEQDVGQDHYVILGVDRRANDAQIRAGYKRSALTAHPDKGGSNRAFQAVSRAFEVLIDKQARALYDASAARSSTRRRAKSLAEVRKAALQRLEKAIKDMPKEKRRESLAGMPSRVSKALLDWMEAQRKAASEPRAQNSQALARSQDSRASAVRNSKSQDLDGPSTT